MKLTHNSRLQQFREPFGAVPVGTSVSLTLHVQDANLADIGVALRTWVDGVGERVYLMTRKLGGVFTVDLPCDEPAIVWYTFIVHDADGSERRVGPRPGAVGGEGAVYEDEGAPSFQITVYEPRETRPSWYERGLVYQIFPDRYRRDDAWRARCERELPRTKGGPARALVEDWDTPPSYAREESGAIARWDFYGGSLEGIRQDLPRLQEMGVTAIYLNPIFEAASNHRYDTGDYLRIDGILGTEDDFRALAAEADARGISLILDGVFNHTGDDSRYFNRYGTYGDGGAWLDPDSPWRGAYRFHEDGSYDCWWGVDNMPDLNEDSPLVRDLVLGPDGAVRRWLRAGARGWRLDVADELSDGFIADIKRALLEERPDGLLLGEVWEDASNKISYGKLRSYLLGSELDGAMNYPFRSLVLDFLMDKTTSEQAAEAIEALRENYPREALSSCLNLLGGHDRPRLLSVLGGAPDGQGMDEEERNAWRIAPDQVGLAKSRFWLAALMQMTFAGVPSIYYGDEAGAQGLSDPANRATYPWGREDDDILTMTRNASALRFALPELFVEGGIDAVALADDVLCFRRRSPGGEVASVIVNRSIHDARVVRVPVENEAAVDLVSGADAVRGEDGCAELHLWPLGSAVVYAHRRQRLQKPMEGGAGVVCHITSVPNEGRAGTLGAPARRFVDHLAAMGMRYWQVLPVNPTDFYGSPYAGPSAFAGNPDLLETDARELRRGYEEFKAAGGPAGEAFSAFRSENAFWLDPYCAFMAVKDALGGAGRHTWPGSLRRYDPAILSDPRFSEGAAFHAYVQFEFDRSWRELTAYAHARGVEIIGDIPMYVSDDSADAWSEPEMFNLDADGRPSEIAGCPPDDFAADGQIWGNPTYRWDRMRADGYRWWIARLRRSVSLYDYVRLDHFLGFQNYFGIPAGGTGADGRWHAGPGIDLFRCACDELGPLPLVAEDLGYLTPAVRALAASCGFPGMDVLEFADYDVRERVAPHEDKIIYTSTHDTSTLTGFCARAFCDCDADRAREVAEDVERRALASAAGTVMMTLQDALLLGDEARMNVPGTAEGNWRWQAREEDVAAAEDRVRDLLLECGRRDR